ncbi:fimbria/pilus periplasmic chaperone [Ideonella sp. 4Y16]|uniref:Fimbria/pilus periplasmic chaperone n=1 Tax=Ideonella aquatica TaxID=2824119 RepID=A0A941BH17_9BURK|nr:MULTISPECIES: fimbria/pilus periplasmic chaperone [Ideonella]MBQ0946160.1 fimbria/pilus periplasmic chaperone [Ideonella alba]MBQ0960416.1 fimbria/pilus periplasmic chaperone [Ideonella aquatica]
MKSLSFRFLRACLVTLLSWACLAPTHASVVIGGTRVVYRADARDVSVQLTNRGVQPALVQAWIDAGDAQAAVERLEVPFVISPPMFRVEPDKTQLLRLVYTGQPLPENATERVYWLNVLEIPPKPDASASENTLQFALRTRIKLFLRPAALAGDDPAESVVKQLRWQHSVSGDQLTITVHNPTPFNASLVDVAPQSTAQGQAAEPVAGMVEPRSSRSFQFKWPVNTPVSGVQFKAINDYGAFLDHHAALP